MKLAFVIQRYGAEVLGGSEHLCRLVAERLAAQHDVEVLTTCARDYVTWKNEYPEGADRIRGVTVRRFANAKTRDLDADLAAGMAMVVERLERAIAGSVDQWVMFQRVWPLTPPEPFRVFPIGSPLESELLKRVDAVLPPRRSDGADGGRG